MSVMVAFTLTPIADEECSATEFKCTSGQCVSVTMHCDGHPDCWDLSDEEDCTKAPDCATKHRCPQSKECLVQEWICDGDQDCKDGTDEKVNATYGVCWASSSVTSILNYKRCQS